MSTRPWDLWRLPTLLLWAVFFLAGLFPDFVFQSLRGAANVLPQRALVNSPHVITIALAAYLASFCYNRCRDAGLTPFGAQDRALQLGVISLIAFLPFDFVPLVIGGVPSYVQERWLYYVIAAMKLLSWLFLFALLLRYYLVGYDDTFAEIPSIFPSARTLDSGPPTHEPARSSEARELDASAPLEREKQGEAPGEVCTKGDEVKEDGI